MKSVLISIQPKWCELIANGRKTLEIRKSKPSQPLPFKCYIYCTNIRPFLVWGDVFRGNWETEFTHLSGYGRKEAERIWDVFNGKVLGEFVCEEITKDTPIHGSSATPYRELLKGSCLTTEELVEYGAGNPLYGWRISNLDVYDTPKDLSGFARPCKNGLFCESCAMYNEFGKKCGNEALAILRPPQSWCYVKEAEN